MSPKTSISENNIHISFLDNIKIIRNNKTYLFERSDKLEGFSPENRRYLGNKNKLLGFIEDIVREHCGDMKSFCDIFAGTGVVGLKFNNGKVKVISNDILNSNFIPLKAFLDTTNVDFVKIKHIIAKLNSIKPTKANYFSKNYGGTYFTIANAKKIGAIREEIENQKLTDTEKNIILTSLIYATDKVANTVGHYDAYRKDIDQVQEVKLLLPKINTLNNGKNETYCEDANSLIRKIKCDVLYLDPPYNSRQYSDAYHLLENLVNWQKPKVFGVAKKMNRDNLKSKYCLKDATEAFEDLINNAKTKHILVSYNNTGGTKNSRSNARISDNEMIRILKNKGELIIYEMSYRTFTTGKTKDQNNTERVFYCKVKNASL